MNKSVRSLVRKRANGRCEYCGMPERWSALVPFHIEHIFAKSHHGTDGLNNLALACHSCNYHKGTNLTGIDSATKAITRLFHPRRYQWRRHFVYEGPIFVGRTAIGRVTVSVLKINDADAVRARQSLIEEGRWRDIHI